MLDIMYNNFKVVVEFSSEGMHFVTTLGDLFVDLDQGTYTQEPCGFFVEYADTSAYVVKLAGIMDAMELQANLPWSQMQMRTILICRRQIIPWPCRVVNRCFHLENNYWKGSFLRYNSYMPRWSQQSMAGRKKFFLHSS